MVVMATNPSRSRIGRLSSGGVDLDGTSAALLGQARAPATSER
jgi:hypothetical protein